LPSARPPAAQAAPVGPGPQPGGRAVECRDVVPGASKQAEDLGAFEADRRALGVVLVVVGGEGLLVSERLHLGREGVGPGDGVGASPAMRSASFIR
jgi:hypothetical protein